MSHETQDIIAFQGDAMLLNWAESNTRGRTVTFLLGDDEDSHPFRDFTVKTGKKAGQRFAMVLVQIGDDEEPVKQTPSQLAFLLCKDTMFWRWINEHSFAHADSEESARAFILETCQVKSRGDIDRKMQAKVLFESMIVQQYNKYRDMINNKAAP